MLRDPTRRVERLVKRVAGAPGDEMAPDRAAVPPGRIFVRGDAAEGSRDSSIFGPVDIREVEGVVWFRYGPLERRGVVDRPTLK